MWERVGSDGAAPAGVSQSANVVTVSGCEGTVNAVVHALTERCTQWGYTLACTLLAHIHSCLGIRTPRWPLGTAITAGLRGAKRWRVCRILPCLVRYKHRAAPLPVPCVYSTVVDACRLGCAGLICTAGSQKNRKTDRASRQIQAGIGHSTPANVALLYRSVLCAVRTACVGSGRFENVLWHVPWGWLMDVAAMLGVHGYSALPTIGSIQEVMPGEPLQGVTRPNQDQPATQNQKASRRVAQCSARILTASFREACPTGIVSPTRIHADSRPSGASDTGCPCS